MMAEVEEGLRRGEPLSDCLDRHAKIFPEYYRGILRSAELTGQLDSVLEQLAKYLERDLEARRKIKAALVYPTVDGRHVAGHRHRAGQLRTAEVQDVLRQPARQTAAAHPDADGGHRRSSPTGGGRCWRRVVIVAVLGSVVLRTERGRLARDRVVLGMPVLGDTVRYALVERFCRVLSSMAGAGVSLPEALRVASDSLRNLVFTRSLSHVGEAMMRGEGLAVPLAGTELFPCTAARMIRVGEETGTLDLQLEVIARYYEGELDYKLKKLTSLFEPVDHRRHGGRRRLRRHRPGVGDVRHLQQREHLNGAADARRRPGRHR